MVSELLLVTVNATVSATVTYTSSSCMLITSRTGGLRVSHTASLLSAPLSPCNVSTTYATASQCVADGWT
jgi:hypothetical protein